MFETVKTALLGAVVFLVVFYVMKCIQFRLKYRLPPGPMAFPLIGNILNFAWGNTMEKFSNYTKTYGHVFSLWLGPKHSITLNTMEAVDEALVKKGADFAGRPHLKSLDATLGGTPDIALGDYGPLWKVMRKIAHVAIRSFSEGEKMTHYLQDNFNDMAKDWTSRDAEFDPREDVTLFTYNIILSNMFGEKFGKDSPEFQMLNKMTTEAMDKIGNGFVTDFLPDWLVFIDKKKYEYFDEIMKLMLDDFFLPKIQKHKDSFDADNLRDLVDHILAVEEKAKTEEDSSVMSQMTDKHFVNILLDIFSAGTDTTRETIISLLLYVGSHPEVQVKMAEELDRVVGPGNLPAVDDVHKLTYTEAVVFETLRMSSLLPLSLPHKTMCDTSVCGYDVPKGSLVLINLFNLQFDPAHWKEPHLFNPDRFIDADGTINKPRAWMPFSGGRRVCPGEAFAKRSLIYITALMFHKFTFKMPDVPAKPLEPSVDSVMMRPPKAFKMTVTERN